MACILGSSAHVDSARAIQTSVYAGIERQVLLENLMLRNLGGRHMLQQSTRCVALLNSCKFEEIQYVVAGLLDSFLGGKTPCFSCLKKQCVINFEQRDVPSTSAGVRSGVVVSHRRGGLQEDLAHER